MRRDRRGYGWFCQGATISEMMHKAIRGHLDCTEPDAVLNIETHLFNTTLTAESCEYDLDVGKHVWLNRGRWSRLMKEYVARESVDRFVDQAAEILRGEARLGATANMMFRDPERYAKKHRWGGCLMGATFRGDGRKAGKPIITFYSRTTYIGYMGLLDAAIAAVIARAIVNASGGVWQNRDREFEVNEIGFRWHISSQQMHSFKSLPYIYSQPDLMGKLDNIVVSDYYSLRDKMPTWYYVAKWYEKVLFGWESWKNSKDPQGWLLTEKYGPFRRIKRRWLEYKRILTKLVPPSLPVSELGFEKTE